MLKEIYFPEKVHCLPEKRNFLSRAGLPSAQQPAEVDFLKKANQVYLLALEVIKPAVFHLTAPVDYFPPELLPESFLNLKALTVFASTLGHSLDDLINELNQKNQSFEAWLVDAWGSESVEALNRHFDRWLRKKHGAGTRRFSPGYGRVDVRMNRFIIKELLNIEEIEVLESGVMLPRKTTTCLIGWYHEKK
jgi:hypothetical protein